MINNNSAIDPPSLEQDLSSIKADLEADMKQIEDATPSDPIAKYGKVKEGTDEHVAVSEHVERVQGINSTRKVLQVTTLIRYIGYVAVCITFLIELMGVAFDIDFHLPNFIDHVGFPGIAVLAMFITLVILILSHATPNGLINNKWESVPRIVLVALFLVAFTASVYFDYRAITNYTSMVMEDVKEDLLSKENTTQSITKDSIDSSNKITNSQINVYQKKMKTVSDRLNVIAEQKKTYNDIITAYASKSKHSKAEWLNKDTSEKALKKLEIEEEKLDKQLELLPKKIDTLQRKVELKSSEMKGEIESLDDELESDQQSRIIFLFVLVFFIKIASFGSFLADFLEDKNLNGDLKSNLHEINSIVNDGAMVKAHVRSLKLDVIKSINADLEVGRMGIKAFNTSGHLQAMGQASTINMLTSNTATLTKSSNEMAKLAVKGVASTHRVHLLENYIEELQKPKET